MGSQSSKHVRVDLRFRDGHVDKPTLSPPPPYADVLPPMGGRFRSIKSKSTKSEECKRKIIGKVCMTALSKAEQYRYEIWVNRDNSRHYGHAQLGIIQYLETLSTSSELSITIRCLDVMMDSRNSTVMILQDMLACDTKERLWEAYESLPKDIPLRHRLENAMTKVKIQPRTSDSTAIGMVRAEVLILLTSFCMTWTPKEFIDRWPEIMTTKPEIRATRDMKIQAQIFAQTENARANLTTEYSGEPTIFLNIVPGQVTASSFSKIQEELSGVVTELQRRDRNGPGTEKQDLVSFQFVSLGKKGEGGQWALLDDSQKGRMDCIDALHLDHQRFVADGPGPGFADKVLLGSVEETLDKRRSPLTYGLGWDWNCTCDGCDYK